MRNDLTDITLVVDRSGSMQQVQSDAEGGINSFIQQQAREPGEALLTLVQFDTEYDFVHRGVRIQDVPEYRLVPRGMTALLDAVGRAMNETGERLAQMPKAERPGLVVFVVMTDGLENSSTEFSRAQIRTMIERQQSKYNWHFTFLGANQDAFAEAGALGVQAAGVANVAMNKIGRAYTTTSDKIARMRKQTDHGIDVINDFTEEERASMS